MPEVLAYGSCSKRLSDLHADCLEFYLGFSDNFLGDPLDIKWGGFNPNEQDADIPESWVTKTYDLSNNVTV